MWLSVSPTLGNCIQIHDHKSWVCVDTHHVAEWRKTRLLFLLSYFVSPFASTLEAKQEPSSLFAQREIERGWGGGVECKTRCFVSAFWMAKNRDWLWTGFFCCCCFFSPTHTHMHKPIHHSKSGQMRLCMFPLFSVCRHVTPNTQALLTIHLEPCRGS